MGRFHDFTNIGYFQVDGEILTYESNVKKRLLGDGFGK